MEDNISHTPQRSSEVPLQSEQQTPTESLDLQTPSECSEKSGTTQPAKPRIRRIRRIRPKSATPPLPPPPPFSTKPEQEAVSDFVAPTVQQSEEQKSEMPVPEFVDPQANVTSKFFQGQREEVVEPVPIEEHKEDKFTDEPYVPIWPFPTSETPISNDKSCDNQSTDTQLIEDETEDKFTEEPYVPVWPFPTSDSPTSEIPTSNNESYDNKSTDTQLIENKEERKPKKLKLILLIAVGVLLVSFGLLFIINNIGGEEPDSEYEQAPVAAIETAPAPITMPENQYEQGQDSLDVPESTQELIPVQEQESVTAIEVEQVPITSPEPVSEQESVVTEEEPLIPEPVATTGYISGHEYVDLGLSVKWATCNVGASSSGGYGNYYAWGETSIQSEYNGRNCTAYGQNVGNIAGTSRDAATVNWGGTWRMPNKAELEELKDRCTWTWTAEGGISGYRVTGPNGNSIFIAASGYKYGSSGKNEGSTGGLWCSSPYSSTELAWRLNFDSSSRSVQWGYRDYGFSIRPVSE